MRKYLAGLLSLFALNCWAELNSQPASLFFGHVPVGYEEIRDLRVCGDELSPDTLKELRISDPELKEVFRIIDLRWRDGCLQVSVSFQPAAEQVDDYRTYGNFGKGEGLIFGFGPSQSYAGGSLLEVVPGDGDPLVVAPVMGIGVSGLAWERDIEPAGWRYGGRVTYRREQGRFISIGHRAMVNRRMIYSDGRELLSMMLNQQDIPLMIKPEPLVRQNSQWVSAYWPKRIMATAGRRGAVSLWKRSRGEWQEFPVSSNNTHHLFVNTSYRPLFNQTGSCLLMPHGDLKNLRRIKIDGEGRAQELEPYPTPNSPWALTQGRGSVFTFANSRTNTIQECELEAESCDIGNCREIKGADRYRAYDLHISPDGRWLVSGGDGDGTVRLWSRKDDRVENNQPVGVYNLDDKWPKHPGLLFSQDSRTLFMVNRTVMHILSVGDEGTLTRVGEYNFRSANVHTLPVAAEWLFGPMSLNRMGDRLFISAQFPDQGLVLFDKLDDNGESRHLRKVEDW
ncbi:WD40 repeat domain-containing protein [Parendozoicomonas haliclonae]|uniref:WD domain, G-beta repeat n=1 Tax=Parendozoicomonas haliclonae TaxID=1960125 RepID=A0A1X7ANP3_9GAMM|nr:WD40 repeat domain-containing protein [Parendozoicomonas haliclonae]SMA49763.1 hypothetical protein EHSB41UT_03552 [Parendozoicomonas haliclonae]